MILHSIIPDEIIYGNQDEPFMEKKQTEITYLGEKVEVFSFDDKSYVITRIISTSPKAYLNPKLQPGSVIRIVNARQ